MNRKEFIKTCSYACIATVGSSLFMEGCATSTHMISVKVVDKLITIKKSEFLTGNNKTPIRKFIIIQNAEYKFPICIYRINESEYSSLLMECTHNSCELQPQGTYLSCPCHGSEFNAKGEVQNPPAEKNLVSFTTTSDNENIYIHL